MVICGRRTEVLETTAKELHERTGGTIVYKSCDIRNYEQVEELIAYGVESLGKIDGLVNNAAEIF